MDVIDIVIDFILIEMDVIDWYCWYIVDIWIGHVCKWISECHKHC
jgi:hypothetical protein